MRVFYAATQLTRDFVFDTDEVPPPPPDPHLLVAVKRKLTRSLTSSNSSSVASSVTDIASLQPISASSYSTIDSSTIKEDDHILNDLREADQEEDTQIQLDGDYGIQRGSLIALGAVTYFGVFGALPFDLWILLIERYIAPSTLMSIVGLNSTLAQLAPKMRHEHIHVYNTQVQTHILLIERYISPFTRQMTLCLHIGMISHIF